MDNKIHLTCESGSEILQVQKFEGEDAVYLTVFKHAFDNAPFWKRVELAWDVLNGRRINTADVVLRLDEFAKLKNFTDD